MKMGGEVVVVSVLVLVLVLGGGLVGEISKNSRSTLPVVVSPTRGCWEDKNCVVGMELRNAIKSWQNPTDCSTKQFTVWGTKSKSGIGAYLATMANGFMEALCSQRIFLLNPSQPWGFPTEKDVMFSSHSLFRPLSSCPIPTNPSSLQVVNKSSSWNTFCVNNKLRAGEDPFDFLFSTSSSSSSSSLFNYTNDRFHSSRMKNFLRAQILRMMLTPNSHGLLHSEMNHFVSQSATFSPSSLTSFLSIHIRLGDKVQERSLPKPVVYLRWANKLLAERNTTTTTTTTPIFLSTETQQVVDYFRENTPEGSQVFAFDYKRIEKKAPGVAARMGDLIPSLTNLFTSQWGEEFVLFPDSHWSILMFDMVMTRGDGGRDLRMVLLRTNSKLLGEMSMLWPRVRGVEVSKNTEAVKVASDDCVGKDSVSIF